MLRALKGIFALAIAFLAIGPVAGLLVGSLRGADGSTQATLLVGQSPVAGAISGLIAFAFAGAAGVIGSRNAGINTGLACAGLVLSWAAWLSGRVDEIVLVTRESPFSLLTLEGVYVAILLGGLVWLIRQTATERHEVETEPNPAGLAVALIAGVAIAGVVGWLLAIEPLKGQTIGAALVAGVVGAAAARLVFLRLPGWSAAAIPALLAILGPLAAQALAGDVVDAVFERSLFRLGWVTPLDWAAGALVGIPIGLAWTDGVVQQHSAPVESPADNPADSPINNTDA